jgi:hypothetical protein
MAQDLTAAFARLAALPVPPVDRPSRHDERRELPAERHAGGIPTPIPDNDRTEINAPSRKISSLAS